MQRRHLPIFILTCILFVAALTGYLIPAKSDGPPNRVLMDNKGGKVILTHARHAASLNQDCAACHHTSGNSRTPLPCGTCHVGKFDDTFRENHQGSFDDNQCAVCHHAPSITDKFSHDDHAAEYTDNDCQTCHHDESIEPEPQACSDCHTSAKTETAPSLKDAVHARCADCHEDFYQDGAKGCTNCHTRKTALKIQPETQACSDCHEESVETLIPTTANAFHTQCMACHEKQGKGPFGDDTCYQCHMK